jgi:glucoamylase
MEAFANGAGLLPEQVWDEEAPRPETGLRFGGPTGSAMPLMWAHAEYIRLLRSAVDGAVFDEIPAVAERYPRPGPGRSMEIWKFNRQLRRAGAGTRLRIQAEAPFCLRWTRDGWATRRDTDSTAVPPLDLHYVDLQVSEDQQAPMVFTFYWRGSGHWEGTNFTIAVDR